MASHDISQGDISEHVSVAVAALKDGFVIVAPLENSYALMADAFFHDAVRAMHVLRGDALGVAAQVAIANKGSIDGIARSISDDARILMDNFWPGALSINLKPQLGLSWDLGDANTLDKISVRVPASEFVLEILKKTGPLAIASAAAVGTSPIQDGADLDFLDVEVAAGNLISPTVCSSQITPYCASNSSSKSPAGFSLNRPATWSASGPIAETT